MTTIRTVAAYEIVQALHPRPPPTERDEVGRAVGRAIDEALSRWNHHFRENRRPSAASVQRFAEELLDGGLKDADVVLPAADRTKSLAEISGVLTAFRRSEVFGLPRPRSRLVLVNSEVGVYAQPDYWDGAQRFYEMKSYRAVPLPPDVALQVSIFQLAFPGFRSFLACFDRHRTPVETTIVEVPIPTSEVRDELLRKIAPLARSLGKEKVLEYIDSPVVRYTVAEVPPPAPSPPESEGSPSRPGSP
jgi:hypothetical protein